jgi:sensor domain CHASE-containing protein
MWLRYSVAAAGSALALLGLLVIIGWHLYLPWLVQPRPSWPPMQYNTALCFVLMGVAFDAWASRRPRAVVLITGGLVAITGCLTMAEYLFHANLGIDQIFFRTYIATEVANAGRMSPISAFCILTVGTAFVLLGLRSTRRRLPLVVGTLASIVMSITAMALLGYAIGLPGTYGWAHLTRIAVRTAAGFGLAGVGLFAIAWNMALRPGEKTPRWLPAPVALGILTGSLILYMALQSKQDDDIAAAIKAGADSARDQVALRMDARIRGFVRMARRWEFAGTPSQAAWQDDAAAYLHDFPEVQAIEVIDTTHRVRWVVPLAGNEGKLNLNLTIEPRRAAAVAKAEEGKPTITRIVDLFHGGLGFVVYVPITIDGKLNGVAAAVFKAQPCLERYLPPAVASGEAIRISDGGQTFFERDTDGPAMRREWIMNEKVELPGATWEMSVWPTESFAARLDSPLPQVVLGLGVVVSLLMGAVCFLGQRAARHAAEIIRANVALKDALDNVQTLQGLLPICSACKRVRDDSGYWAQIDTYIHDHTNASLSHGYCPECAAKAFRECGFEVPEKVQAELNAGNFEKAPSSDEIAATYLVDKK